jgi:pyruvyltransferase
VRGKLTAKRIGVKDIPFGDPLLLWQTVKQPRYKLGIVPHYVDFSEESIWEFARKHEEVLVIDMLARDAAERIASCENILSSALHGLVVADALEIPNLWTLFSDNKVVGHGFKFRDYYSAFGIDDPIPNRFNRVLPFSTVIEMIGDEWTPKPIEMISHDLLASFPAELKA